MQHVGRDQNGVIIADEEADLTGRMAGQRDSCYARQNGTSGRNDVHLLAIGLQCGERE